MKKGIIVLLIAVLVSSFAFAKLSGSAGVKLGGDLDFNAFGTINAQSLDFSFTFASEEVKIDSSEDEIHVEVAASAKFILGELNPKTFEDWDDGIYIGPDHTFGTSARGIGAVISLDTAKIVGKNWYVDITGTQGAYDYAKAAVLEEAAKKVKDDFGNYKKTDNQAATYALNFSNCDGVTVGYNDFTASAGFEYIKDFAFLATATVETPEFAFNDDAVKVQAAAEFGRFKLGTKGSYVAYTSFGASAKATVAVQDITVGVAADMGVENIGAEIAEVGVSDKETQFNIDARVDFKYNFVDASIYTYAGKAGLKSTMGVFDKFYLEAKAAFDLNAFELPLKVTVKAKNITDADVKAIPNPVKVGIAPSVLVEYAKDAITAGASFEINTKSKAWNTLVYGTYAFEKFTAGAGVKVAGATELTGISFGAFAESDKIVKGATFGLSYGLDSDNTYGKGGANSVTNGKFSNDFKADPVKKGEVLAYCKIAF